MSTSAWIRGVAVALALAVGAIGCTRDDGAEREPAPTTLPEGVDLWEVSPEIASESAADLLIALDEVEENRDMCGLVAVFESGLPFFDDPDGVIAVYDRLAVVVSGALEWVPAALADDWDPIESTVAAGALVVQEARGDLTSPGVAATFGGDDFQRSVITVVRWSERTCPDGGSDPSE